MLSLSEGSQKLWVLIDFKVFSFASLLDHIRHSFNETEDFNLDFNTVIDHDEKFADFSEDIDDLYIRVFINDWFSHLKADKVVSDNYASKHMQSLVKSYKCVIGELNDLGSLMLPYGNFFHVSWFVFGD